MRAGKMTIPAMLVALVAVSGLVVAGLTAGSANAVDIGANSLGMPAHQNLSFATRSADCAPCHQREYNEWRYAAGSDLDTVGIGSHHAITSTDANYVSILPRVPLAIKPYCQGCHEGKDAWGVEDKWDKIPQISDLNKDEGTNCVTCHFDPKTGQLVLNSQFVDPNMLLCATCHNEDTGMTDLANEWKTDFIGTGGTKTCLDCHMPKGDAPFMPQGKANHVMPGFNSDTMRKKALTISDPMLPDTVAAGMPFDIQYTVANTGMGHSMPEDLFRLLRCRISVVDAAGAEVFNNEVVYYKKKRMLGEDQAATDVIKARTAKNVTVPGVVIATPGTYTVKLEVLQNSNRVFVDRNITHLMGATYKTVVVQ